MTIRRRSLLVARQYTFKSGDTWERELTTPLKGEVEGASDEDSTVDETTRSRTTSSVTAVSEEGVGTLEVTKAPEDMVPADERGPFKMDLTMTMTQVEVR